MFTTKDIRHILINFINHYIAKTKIYKQNCLEKFKAIFLFTENENLKDLNIFIDNYFNFGWYSSASREKISGTRKKNK